MNLKPTFEVDMAFINSSLDFKHFPVNSTSVKPALVYCVQACTPYNACDVDQQENLQEAAKNLSDDRSTHFPFKGNGWEITLILTFKLIRLASNRILIVLYMSPLHLPSGSSPWVRQTQNLHNQHSFEVIVMKPWISLLLEVFY